MKLKAEEHKEAISTYLTQIMLRPKSSEHALHTLLDIGAWAKKPLVHRMPCL